MAGNELEQKREQLFRAAEGFVLNGKTTEEQRKLCEAASAYHAARTNAFKAAHGTPKAATNGNGARYVVPFGRTKGTPIGEAEPKDLNYIIGRLKESLDDPDKQHFRAKNEELIAAIEAELETR